MENQVKEKKDTYLAVFFAIFLGCFTNCLPFLFPFALALLVAAFSDALKAFHALSGKYLFFPLLSPSDRDWETVCKTT